MPMNSNDARNTRRIPTVVIVGSVPAQAGGRASTGLSYSIWNIVRFIAPGSTDIQMLATNILNRGMNIGAIPLARFRWHDLALVLPRVPAILLRGWRYGVHNSGASEIIKCVWYAAVFRRLRPNVVHAHGALTVLQVRAAEPRAKILGTFHGVISESSLPKDHRQEALALASCARVVTVTGGTFSRLSVFARYSGPRDVIFNGVDPALFTASGKRIDRDGRKITILHVASLNENKNQMLVLQSIARSVMKDRIRYVTVGEGGLADRLSTFAASAGIDYTNIARVRYEELPAHYRNADITILVSTNEGFGMSVIESLACGTPVIVASHIDIASEQEILRPENSFMVQMDTFESLTNLMDRLPLALNAIDPRAVRYDVTWQSIAAKYVTIYSDMVNNE